MTTDLTLSSAAQVLALINTDNAVALTPVNVSFGTPISLVDDISGKNTEVNVQSQLNGGYLGDVSVKYDRLDLDVFEVYGEPNLVFPIETEVVDLPGVINLFNGLYGANLSAVDVDESVVLPAVDYVGTSYVFTANAGSLAYIGSIEVSLSLESIALNFIIPEESLGGLTFPIPQGEKLTGTVGTIRLPTNLQGAGAAIIDNILYIYGGATTSTGSGIGTLRRLDISTGEFLTNGNAGSGLRYSSMVAIGRGLYVLGGNSTGTVGSSSVRRYDVDLNTWTTVGALTTGALRGQAAASGNVIYLHTARADSNYDVIAYDVSTNTAVDIPTPFDAVYSGVVTLDDKVYVFGGGTQPPPSGATSALWVYDISEASWTQLADRPDTPLSVSHYAEVKLCTIGGYIYCYGGGVSSSSTDLWCYDPVENVWETIVDLVEWCRYHAVATDAENLYVVGGNSNGGVTNTILKIS